MLELLGRSANSIRWTPLQKQETKRIDGGSFVAFPMPKSVLSGEEKINYLGNEFSVRTFHRLGGLVFIIDDHDNFPSWMITLNSIFPCWKKIRYSSHWVGDFFFPYRKLINKG